MGKKGASAGLSSNADPRIFRRRSVICPLADHDSAETSSAWLGGRGGWKHLDTRWSRDCRAGAQIAKRNVSSHGISPVCETVLSIIIAVVSTLALCYY